MLMRSGVPLLAVDRKRRLLVDASVVFELVVVGIYLHDVLDELLLLEKLELSQDSLPDGLCIGLIIWVAR